MDEAPHRWPVRVYYEDTDFSGAVYHAGYLRFMERGRTEFIRSRGIEQANLTDEAGRPLGFVVRHMAIEFLKPARMDDQLVVETWLRKVGGASLTLDQHVLREDAVLATAHVQVVLVGGERPRRLPPRLRSQLLD